MAQQVSLFVTCFNDTLFPEAGKAAVAVLERVGCEVEFRAEQTCCGQMHHNSGYRSEALSLLRRFVKVFAEADSVVSPSASCVAMVRDVYPQLAAATGDAGLVDEVAAVADRTWEFCQFLTDVVGVTDVGAYYPHRVTYHPTCHSLRLLRLGDRATRLLDAVRGLELVPMSADEECCGFGGTFAVKNAEMSTAILADKTRHVLNTGAEVCCAVDTSCLMHIGGALSRQQTGVRTMHVAQILASTESK